MWTQQVPPAFCAALKVQRKHEVMKKQGLTVQLFIPEFKTTTWGKRLAKKVSWRVAGSRRAGGFRATSLSPNQLNKSLDASDWAADYVETQAGSLSTAEAVLAFLSKQNTCWLAHICERGAEVAWSLLERKGEWHRWGGGETRVFCDVMSVRRVRGAESALLAQSPTP